MDDVARKIIANLSGTRKLAIELIGETVPHGT